MLRLRPPPAVQSDLLMSNSLTSRSGGLTYAEASNFKPALQMSDSRFGQHLRHSILGNHHLAHLESQLEADIEHMENALPEHKKTYAVGAPPCPSPRPPCSFPGAQRPPPAHHTPDGWPKPSFSRP